MTSNKTFSPTPRDIERHWYVVDADGAVLGRLASEVAKVLRGKHKPIFAPHMDTGDHVIVVNARGIRLTGGKEGKKIYYRHSGYPGGLREEGYARLLAERPVVAVEKAIRGMLPKNRLGRAMVRKLAVYEGPEHPHRAQKPEPLQLGAVPSWDGLPAPKPAPQPKPKAAEPKPGAAKRGTAKAATAKGATAKGATAKRSTAKAGTAKRATAKAATAKAATAKRSTAKAATAKRATAEPAAEPESEKES